MDACLSWFKLVLTWSCAGRKQLAPAQDQFIGPAHDQLKQASMLQNLPNQHMLFFSTGSLKLERPVVA